MSIHTGLGFLFRVLQRNKCSTCLSDPFCNCPGSLLTPQARMFCTWSTSPLCLELPYYKTLGSFT